jgi:predicted amidohydrolase
MSRLAVAIAQIRCEPGGIAANLDAHLSAIDEARRRGAGLLLFPELSLTDYLADAECGRLAMPRDAEPLRRLAAAADGIAVSAGFIERDGDGRPYNSQGLFRDGALVAVHRKLNLPGYGALREDRVYAPGAEGVALAAPAPGWSAVMLVCADAWNPALPWLAALSGADLFLVPAASARGAVGGGFDNPRGWELTLAYMAMTYGAPVLFANHCGTRGDAEFWGGSRILDASGQVLAQAGDQPALIVAELDAADGVAARRRLPTIRDSDPHRVRRLLAGILAGG